MKKIGVLTGGGDCPGLDATIRAVVKKGIKLPVEDKEESGFVLQSTKKDAYGHVMLGGVGSVLAKMIEKVPVSRHDAQY